MDKSNTFIDGGGFITQSPFHSWYFVVASLVGAAGVTVDIYLLIRYRNLTTIYFDLVLGVAIGLQLVYQWLRALRYYAKIRALCATSTESVTNPNINRDMALQVAAGGLTDILMYGFGTALLALILIGFLLSRLTGVTL